MLHKCKSKLAYYYLLFTYDRHFLLITIQSIPPNTVGRKDTAMKHSLKNRYPDILPSKFYCYIHWVISISTTMNLELLGPLDILHRIHCISVIFWTAFLIDSH